ncbi:hypothetical protein CFter6_4641 [Collimonas fungivorans]|uniref:Uncharacterized protein n=1 Tax=Collimonas fungivorans TaxID=158899 RepID=A0A127PHX4_9BURK|nr:hypothetical protein CFter6_4641 [Collimonas fungivorans]
MSSPSYTSFLVAGFLPAANTVQTHFFWRFSALAYPDNALLFDCIYQNRRIRDFRISCLCFFSSKRTRVLFFFLHYASFRII